MGYQEGDVEGLIKRSNRGPGFLKQLFGNTFGKYAMNKRRPVGYETDKSAKNVQGDPNEENWTNTTREALYAKLFGQDARFGSDIYSQDDSGAYILNPDAEGDDAQKAKEIQIMLNESFAKAKQGDKVSHPDFPDRGEEFYRGTDKTMGEAFFDEEGNVVDYWDIGLDKGEKWLGSKSNFLRGLISPFTTPATFKGKATDSGNVLGEYGFSGDSDASDPSLEQPSDDTSGKGGGFLKKLFGGKGFQGSGGGTGVLTGPRMTADYADAAKGPSTGRGGPISRESSGEQPRESSGKNILQKLLGGEGFQGEGGGKGYGEDAGPLYKAPEEDESMGGGPIDRKALMKGLGLGDDEEEEEYEGGMMDKIKGLGYRGSSAQNLQLLEALGGGGPSIVDFLKGGGKQSSFGARRKLWEQFG